MYKFLVRVVHGKIVPEQPSKIKLLNDILYQYEVLDKKFYITIETGNKNVSEEQQRLYRAFVLRASEYFGNTFEEMENILKRFHPLNSFHLRDYKPVSKWSSDDLNNFINQATALLAEHGFKF